MTYILVGEQILSFISPLGRRHLFQDSMNGFERSFFVKPALLIDRMLIGFSISEAM
jgi:hypothetical protein